MASVRERWQFESSWISQAWYSPDEKVIEVEFTRNGHRHLYLDCEADTWRRFKTADSPGRFVQLVLERHRHRGR